MTLDDNHLFAGKHFNFRLVTLYHRILLKVTLDDNCLLGEVAETYFNLRLVLEQHNIIIPHQYPKVEHG